MVYCEQHISIYANKDTTITNQDEANKKLLLEQLTEVSTFLQIIYKSNLDENLIYLDAQYEAKCEIIKNEYQVVILNVNTKILEMK